MKGFRNMFFTMFMVSVLGAYAPGDTLVPGDTLTLWFKDEGDGYGFYQGLFRVDTVVQHGPEAIVLATQRDPVSASYIGGGVEATGFLMGIGGHKPFFHVSSDTLGESFWWRAGSYDENFGVDVRAVDAFTYSTDFAALLASGNLVFAAPRDPLTEDWTGPSVTLDQEIRDVAVSPKAFGVARTRTAGYALADHDLFWANRMLLSSTRLATPLYVSEFYEAALPYSDQDAATHWIVEQGTSPTSEDVVVAGKTYGSLHVTEGTRIRHPFAFPMEEQSYQVILDLFVRSNINWWIYLSGPADTLRWHVTDSMVTLVTPDTTIRIPVTFGSVREKFSIILEVVGDSVAYRAGNASFVFSRSSWGPMDAIVLDVQAIDLFADRIRVAPYFLTVEGANAANGRQVWVATTDYLYLYNNGTWSRMKGWQGGIQSLAASPGTSDYIGAVSLDGQAYVLTLEGADSVSITRLPLGSQVRATAMALDTTAGTPSVVLVGTDSGLVIFENFAERENLADQLYRWDPVGGLYVHSIHWLGGDTAYIATEGGFFRIVNVRTGQPVVEEMDEGMDPSYYSPSLIQALADTLPRLLNAVDSVLGFQPSGDTFFVLLANLTHHVGTAEGVRIPMFAVVDPELNARNGRPTLVLDATFPVYALDESDNPAGSRADVFPIPVRYLQNQDEVLPEAYSWLLRGITKSRLALISPAEEVWVNHMLAEVVIQTFLAGGRDPVSFVDTRDVALELPASLPTFTVGSFPTVFKTPTQYPDISTFYYVMGKYVLEKANTSLPILLADTLTGWNRLVAWVQRGDTTIHNPEDLLLSFMRDFALGRISTVPNATVRSFATIPGRNLTWRALGSDALTTYGFRFFEDVLSQDVPSGTALHVNALPGERIWIAVFRQGTQIELLGEGMTDTLWGDGAVSLQGNLANGDTVTILAIRLTQGVRDASEIALSFTDTTLSGITLWFLQDPFTSTKVIFGANAPEALYSEFLGQQDIAFTQGPTLEMIYQTEFGLEERDTLVLDPYVPLVPVSQRYYQTTLSLPASQVVLNFWAEDVFGNQATHGPETLSVFTLNPQAGLAVLRGDFRVEIPEGAASRSMTLLVNQVPADVIHVLYPEVPGEVVGAIQVGSYGHFLKEYEITYRTSREVQAFVFTPTGWMQVPTLRRDEQTVVARSDTRGLMVFVQGSSAPQVIRFALPRKIWTGTPRVIVETPRAMDFKLQVFDALGREVWRSGRRLDPGRFEVPVEVHRAGVYFLKIQSPEGGLVDRFMVVR